MGAFAPRPERRHERHSLRVDRDDDLSWLEHSDGGEISPASLWSIEDEPKRPPQDKPEQLASEEPPKHSAPEHRSATVSGWITRASLSEESDDSGEQEQRSAWWMAEIVEESDAQVVTGPQEPEQLMEPTSDVAPQKVVHSRGWLDESIVVEEPIAPEEVVHSTGQIDESIVVEETAAPEEVVHSRGWLDESIVVEEPIAAEEVVHSRRELDESIVVEEKATPEAPINAEMLEEEELDEDTLVPNVSSSASSHSGAQLEQSEAIEDDDVPLNVVQMDQAATAAAIEETAQTVETEKPQPRPRLLDDSVVLPHEASFATVPLFRESYNKHSAASEFAAKVTYRAKRVLPTLLVIVFGGAMIVLGFKVLASLESQQPLSPDAAVIKKPAPEVKNPAPQAPTVTQSASPAQAVEPVTTKTETLPTAPTVTSPTAPETVSTPVETTAAAAPVQKSTAKRKASPTQDAPQGSTENVAKTKAGKPGNSDAPVETAARNASRPAADANNEETNVKNEVPAAPSGGGERPRRVQQSSEDSSSGGAQNPAKSSTPKVIPWP